MKKIIIPFMLAFTSSMANAEYIIQIPFEQAQGGPLSNNSIVFVTSTEVVPETPVKHEPVDCITKPTDPQLCEKSLTAWNQFADAQNPKLPKDWNYMRWGSKGLSYLPNEPYPIKSVHYFNLSYNQLTNVDGLINLTSVGTLYLSYNKLTNVDGLSNLTSVGTLYLHENQLTNVDGLANLKVTSTIIVEKTYKGPKLASNTRFCTENPASVFYSGYARKSQVCESP